MDIPVEPGEPVHIFPYLFIAGMENVGSVFVDLDALDFLRIDVTCYMAAFFDNKACFPGFFEFMRENRPVQACSHDQKIIFGFH